MFDVVVVWMLLMEMFEDDLLCVLVEGFICFVIDCFVEVWCLLCKGMVFNY